MTAIARLTPVGAVDVDAASRAQSVLFFDRLLRTREPSHVLELAPTLGIEDVRRRLVLLVDRSPEPDRTVDRLLPDRSTVVRMSDHVVIVLECRSEGHDARSWARRTLDAAVAASVVREHPSKPVVVSTTAADLRALPQVHREATALRTLAADRRGAPTGIAVDDLGPARLLLVGPSGSETFARELLGPVLGDDPQSRKLRDTIRALGDAAGHITRTASALSVHQNTVRTRLDRVRELTGLDLRRAPDDLLLARAALIGLDAARGASGGT